jgi:hypothetical protein
MIPFFEVYTIMALQTGKREERNEKNRTAAVHCADGLCAIRLPADA